MYWITGLLGLAIAVSPFMFNYLENTTALLTSLLLGGAVMLVSFLEALAQDQQRWEYWVAALVGVGVMVAPFVLNLGGNATAVWTSMGIGLLLALVSGTKLFYDKERLA